MIATKRDYYLTYATMVSFAMHLLVAVLYFMRSPTLNPITSFVPIEVTLIPDSDPKHVKKSETQIITPPKTTDDKISPEITRLSDIDSATKKEQLRRGLEEQAVQTVQKTTEKSKPAPENTLHSRPETNGNSKEPRHAATKLTLRLDAGDLLASEKESDSPESKDQKLKNEIQNAPQRAVLGGHFGSPDFLPSVPDGEVTLLNAKANQFAVFVRRVASQVFSHLTSAGWNSLRASDLRAIQTDAFVRATMSKTGNLISAQLEDASGASRFDEVLLEAIRAGVRDANPPPQAAGSDGNYHFIFKARSWVQIVPAGRSGAPVERRWLMLGTGLE